MLREIQIRVISKRTFDKKDLLPFLRDQNVRLAKDGVWLPLHILRARFEEDWLNQEELSELIVKYEVEEEIDRLERSGSSLPKGPDLIVLKRDIWDPVIDKYSKPGKRQLSEFVCPANWQYYAREEASSSSNKLLEEVVVLAEDDPESGCFGNGFRLLVAKVRNGKTRLARFRKRRVCAASRRR